MGGRLDPQVATARTLVRTAVAELEPGQTVLVAVSGGADSLALAAAAAFVCAQQGLRGGAALIDHRLQPGSSDIAVRAAEQVRGLGFDPVEVIAVDVGGQGGPEAAARSARYAALSASAERHEARAVLLGHTLDDQAETVLLGLARGSGPRSLAGMAPVDGIYRRPFLTLSRTQTERVCVASGLDWWQDPHNRDGAYARVRVRRDALPALERTLGPGVTEALARTAALVRDDVDLLDQLAGEAWSDVSTADGLAVRGLIKLARALRTRIIRRAALEAGAPATDLAAVHIGEVDRLLINWHGQQRIELPGGVVAVRRGDTLSIARSVAG